MKTHYLAWLLLTSACATTVRPEVLREAEKVAQGASAKESQQLAPQLYLRAEKLRKEADDELARGKTPAAEVKAERAIAAYEHAQILARIVKAEQRLVTAKAELTAQQTESLALDGRRQTVAAELASLDAEIQVQREAESIAESKVTSGEREAARKKAASTVLINARLLCIAAEQLGADKPSVEAELANVTVLEAQTQSAKGPFPFNLAIKSRSHCLELLTLARRPARTAAPNSEATDRLFLALGEAFAGPIRDERGISVTFRAEPSEAQIKQLAELALKNGNTPLLVVTHVAKAAPAEVERARGEKLAKQLEKAGAPSVRVLCTGDRLPLESGLGTSAAKLNERIELVYVTRL